MTANIPKLLDTAWKNLEVEKDDWCGYLENPQSINQKFFTGQANLSLDMFTLTEIYHALTASFVRVLPKLNLKDDCILFNDVKAANYSYESLINWIETFVKNRDLKIKERYVSKAENLLRVILISDYHCLYKLERIEREE